MQAEAGPQYGLTNEEQQQEYGDIDASTSAALKQVSDQINDQVTTAAGGSLVTQSAPLTDNEQLPDPVIQLQNINVDAISTPAIHIVGAEGAQGYWGVAQSILPAGASNAEIEQQALQLMTANPGVTTLHDGDVLNLGDGSTSAEAQQTYNIMDQSYQAQQLAELQPVIPSASLLAEPSQAPVAAPPVSSAAGFLAENQASADAYWEGVQDNAVSQGSFLEYAGAGIMQKLADFGYGTAETAVAMYNDPGSAAAGAGKAIVNFGPQFFNGVTDLAKTSLDGLTLLAEQTPFVPDGEFSGFRSTDPYNIPLLAPYTNQAEVGGAVLANLAIGGALGEFGDVPLQSPITVGDSVPYAFGQSGAISFRLQSPFAGSSAGTGAEASAEAEQLSQVQLNNQSGAAFQARVADYSSDIQDNYVEELSIKPNTADGPADFRVRLDGIGEDPATGSVVLTDAKSSVTAGFTPNQTVGYPLIEQYGGTVVGANGGNIYPAGTSIPPTTVTIIRPGDLPEGY